MDQASAQRSAISVGVITLCIGIALVAFPSRAARILRAGDHPAALRVIGLSDLALVPGLLFGRRRADWMTARAATNLMIAAYCVRLVRQEGVLGAKLGAAAMAIATVADGRTIVALRRAT
jgi:hypothetical protein